MSATPARELEEARRRLVSQPPSSRAWMDLGHAHWKLGAYAQAKKAFTKALALGGATADDLCDFGVLRMTTGDHMRLARPLLERALATQPGHLGALEWLAYARMVEADYAGAAQAYEDLGGRQPNEPRYPFLLALALRQSGRGPEALASLERAAALNSAWFSRTRHPAHLAQLAQCLFVAGQADRARQTLTDFHRQNATVKPYWDYPEYLPGMHGRIARYQEMVAGRDMVVLAKGPSLALFDQAAERFADLDLCYFIFNGPSAEDDILARVGRRASLACVSAPNVLNNSLEWLRGFLARPEPNFFFTDAHCMNSLAVPGDGRQEMEARHGERLMYFRAVHRHPPNLADPLHFPPINTLSMVLGLAALGRPRRVFLFGGDGMAAPRPRPDGATFYYHADQERLNAGERDLDEYREAYQAWLRYDTVLFDAQMQANVACLAASLGFEPPEIYNCSRQSAYQSMPKISLGACLAMLRQ